MFTDVFAADDIEASARRPGFVQRTSTLTGPRLLALVTCGAWSEAKTTVAPLAAQGSPWSPQGDSSPEAIHHRLHNKAMACLPDLIRQPLASLPTLDPVRDDGRLPALTHVYIADRTGLALPDALHTTFPGAGGRAANAGATMQAGWD